MKEICRIFALVLSAATFMLVISSASSNPVFAQIVRVESGPEVGHGFVLRHGGVCYLITPRHVTGSRRIATVKTASPMRSASATMESPFWDDMDLAIGTVRAEGLGDYCRTPLTQFDQSLEVDAGQPMHLLRLRDTGEVERSALEFEDARYLTFKARMARQEDAFFRGTSGAFAFVGDRPMGMVVSTTDGQEGQFIRIEELYQNIARWVQRSVRFVGTAPSADTAPLVDGMRIVLHSVTQPPLNSDTAPENMRQEGAYVFPAGRNQIIFRIPGVNPGALARIDLRSDPDADYALPRLIRVEVSTATEPTAGWRHFAEAEMAPDGVFTINRSAQLARWVRFTIETAQDFGPIGIEAVLMR
jgi:hypothetical protein